jgi:hypothetical protein
VLLADIYIARIDAVLRQCLRAIRIFFQQNMSVVMEVANDRHSDSEFVEALGDLRHSRGRLLRVDGDPDKLRAGGGERHHLVYSRCDVFRVGVGHRLDDDRIRAAHFHSGDIHDRRGTAQHSCHN